MDPHDRKPLEEVVHCYNWIHLSSIGSIGRTIYQVRGCTAVEFYKFLLWVVCHQCTRVYIFIDIIDMNFIDSTRVTDMLSLGSLYIHVASDSGSQFISFLLSQTYILLTSYMLSSSPCTCTHVQKSVLTSCYA